MALFLRMSDCVQCKVPVRQRQEGLECDILREGSTGLATLNETSDHDGNTSVVNERPFVVPETVLEQSIEDEAIGEVDIGHNTSQDYNIIENGTNRGKRKLVDSQGFSYTLKCFSFYSQKQKNDHVVWRCCKRQKSSNCLKMATHLNKDVKERSKLSIFTKSAPAIVEEVMRQYTDVDAPEPSRPNPSYLTRVCNRLRQKERPKDPVNLQQEVDTDFIDGHCPDFFRRDITVGDRRHLLFSTDRQLQLLWKAKTWYMDGTFRVINYPWTQLFSIHPFIKSGDFMKQVPLVFCIMSGKRKEDYYEVLRAVDHLLPEEISLQDFVADFESGLWLALKERFPRFPVQGCVFHWAQSVFRKVQEHGLQAAYNQRDSIYKFLRQIMSLPFLPPEHIQEMFNSLCARANTPELSAVIQYQRKKTRQVQGKIFDTWDRYCAHEITASQLLRICASVYGPSSK
ncbi:hypothetical protein KUTeg_012275 [Tegillarca granosa]|uniref:MULE transposase domain-containing protein n=1 Tax=Tegillarca granosa TaxID=220873 RepID=A0ABQ9F479_TEGGR|nr:hypothetical protein KUTeg_012275 [Tegillarca granosa]